MNQELQQALAAFIQKTMSTLQTASDFASVQIPDVLHQLILYKTVALAVWVVLGLLLLVGTPLLSFQIWHKADDPNGYGWSEVQVIIVIATMISMVIGLILICVNTSDLLEITLAPKVWLLDYARQLAGLTRGHG